MWIEVPADATSVPRTCRVWSTAFARPAVPPAARAVASFTTATLIRPGSRWAMRTRMRPASALEIPGSAPLSTNTGSRSSARATCSGVVAAAAPGAASPSPAAITSTRMRTGAPSHMPLGRPQAQPLLELAYVLRGIGYAGPKARRAPGPRQQPAVHLLVARRAAHQEQVGAGRDRAHCCRAGGGPRLHGGGVEA